MSRLKQLEADRRSNNLNLRTSAFFQLDLTKGVLCLEFRCPKKGGGAWESWKIERMGATNYERAQIWEYASDLEVGVPS